MAQSIGKFAGVGEGTGKSLLGMLGPVVLGALGQQQRSAGLDEVDWPRFSVRKRIRSPRQFRPDWPIS